jgi:hypothetical protein
LSKLSVGKFLGINAGSKRAVGKLAPRGAAGEDGDASANKGNQYTTLRSFA